MCHTVGGKGGYPPWLSPTYHFGRNLCMSIIIMHEQIKIALSLTSTSSRDLLRDK